MAFVFSETSLSGSAQRVHGIAGTTNNGVELCEHWGGGIGGKAFSPAIALADCKSIKDPLAIVALNKRKYHIMLLEIKMEEGALVIASRSLIRSAVFSSAMS